MTGTQRNLCVVFSVFVALLLAATTAVLAFAVRTTKRDYRGDLFDKLVAEHTVAWLQPTLICLGGAFLVGIVLFIGLWQYYSNAASSNPNERNTASLFMTKKWSFQATLGFGSGA